ECGYTGPYFDKNNQQTTMSGADYCTKRYDSCNARRNYFANGVIHFGGFIGATRYG
ncbi:phage minor tail protein L, partial [Yersinia pestis]